MLYHVGSPPSVVPLLSEHYWRSVPVADGTCRSTDNLGSLLFSCAETTLRLKPTTEADVELTTLIHHFLQKLALAFDAPPLTQAAALLATAALQTTPREQRKLAALMSTMLNCFVNSNVGPTPSFTVLDDLIDLRNGSVATIPNL